MNTFCKFLFRWVTRTGHWWWVIYSLSLAPNVWGHLIYLVSQKSRKESKPSNSPLTFVLVSKVQKGVGLVICSSDSLGRVWGGLAIGISTGAISASRHFRQFPDKDGTAWVVSILLLPYLILLSTITFENLGALRAFILLSGTFGDDFESFWVTFSLHLVNIFHSWAYPM